MRNFVLTASILLACVHFSFAQCISGDCSDGTGIFLYPSGAKYIGQFKSGEIHGVGACYYTDGSKYQGEWVNRYPEGNGTMTFPDGTKWTGSWRRGHPINQSGQIIEDLFTKKEVEFDENNIQSGCISGDCKTGNGIFAYPDGSKYEGQFENGQPNGWGTFYFVDGEKYIGNFKNGYSHGKGTFYHTDGAETQGEWKDGEYVGNPIIEDGKFGCINGDCKNGRGTYIYKNGQAKYVGQFQNELPQGRGAVYYANGERYVGEWMAGSFEGFGTLYLLDGTEVKGNWKKGTFMGKAQVNEEPVLAENDPKTEPETIEQDTVASEAPAEIVETIFEEDFEEPVAASEPQQDTKSDILTARNAGQLKVWAVIVGVSSYNHMPTLRYTDDDAYRMFAFLKSPEGGALTDEQIKVLIDEEATKQNIENTMREVYSKAGPNDLIMLYFSGHGLKGSFLPIDYDGYNNKLPHEDVNKILNESQAKYKLCIADACHSGSLLAMKSGEISNALESYYKSLAQAQAGTALLMSSKSDETSLESSGLRQGVFSHFLIRGLKGEADSNNDKIVTMKELFDFVDKNVRSYTGNRQSPLLRGDYDEKMTVAVIR